MTEETNALVGQEGEVRMTIQITRAATGLTEEYELVGKADEDQINELIQSTQVDDNGCNT